MTKLLFDNDHGFDNKTCNVKINSSLNWRAQEWSLSTSKAGIKARFEEEHPSKGVYLDKRL